MLRILPGIIIPLVLLAAICLTPARTILPAKAPDLETVQAMHAGPVGQGIMVGKAPAGNKYAWPGIDEIPHSKTVPPLEARPPAGRPAVSPAYASPATDLFTSRFAVEVPNAYPELRPDRLSAFSPASGSADSEARVRALSPLAAAAVPPPLDRLSFTSVLPAALAPRPDLAQGFAAPAGVADIPNLDRDLIAFLDAPPASASRTGTGITASGTAFANLTDGLGPQMSCPASVCTDPPPKGLMLFARGKYYQERQQPDWKKGLNSNYEQKTSMIGLGFMQDWSVNTTVGLAADIVNAQVDSRWGGDTRSNNIRGWLLEGNVKTSVADKYPVDLSAMYGRLKHDGTGAWNDLAWHEDDHKSMMYGVTGKIGVPLVFGDDFKLAPNVGFQFLALQSDGYQATTTQNQVKETYNVGEQTSKSLAVPINLDLRKEYPLCYGMFTPQLNLGLIKEFSDSAMALRSFNSAAASAFSPAGGVSPIDSSQSLFYKAGVGLELSTFGGWRIRADYAHYFASKYSNDTFRAEISRCF